MHKTTAYERRESLGLDELRQLLTALEDDVQRYRVGIRGYTPDKMRSFGEPHLARLDAQVAEIERLVRERGAAA